MISKVCWLCLALLCFTVSEARHKRRSRDEADGGPVGEQGVPEDGEVYSHENQYSQFDRQQTRHYAQYETGQRRRKYRKRRRRLRKENLESESQDDMQYNSRPYSGLKYSGRQYSNQQYSTRYSTEGNMYDYPDTQEHQYGQQRHERDRLKMEQDQLKMEIRHKLLIILLDGFRWDYLERYQQRRGEVLQGFAEFQREGIRAEYLESVFPAESFPAWQTLQTGLYPGYHDIVGNQFYDPLIEKQKRTNNAFFNIDDQRSTEHLLWWQRHEPLWATAKKHNVSFAAYLFGRCDLPYDALTRLRVDYCEHLYQKDGSKTLRIMGDKALWNFQSGYDAAIIYDDSLERAAEDYGPNSETLDTKLKMLDEDIKHLSNRLNITNMADVVNVVILSDHGMAAANGPMRTDQDENDHVDTVRIQLSDRLSRENVRWIVGSGSHAKIYTRGNVNRPRETIINSLSDISTLEVYNNSDIPERFHYKMSRNSPHILVLAKPGTVIDSSTADVQRPIQLNHPHKDLNPERLTGQVKFGLAGYDPQEPDMRGIFMAKGPAFKSTGDVGPPIRLVDIYELLCKVLDIPPRPNNGTLENVMYFLRGGQSSIYSTPGLLYFMNMLVILSFAHNLY